MIEVGVSYLFLLSTTEVQYHLFEAIFLDEWTQSSVLIRAPRHTTFVLGATSLLLLMVRSLMSFNTDANDSVDICIVDDAKTPLMHDITHGVTEVLKNLTAMKSPERYPT